MASIIKKDRVLLDARPAAAPRGSSDPTEACPTDPRRVELLHVDGAVRGIEVTCPCGEVMVVEFEFERGAEAPEE